MMRVDVCKSSEKTPQKRRSCRTIHVSRILLCPLILLSRFMSFSVYKKLFSNELISYHFHLLSCQLFSKVNVNKIIVTPYCIFIAFAFYVAQYVTEFALLLCWFVLLFRLALERRFTENCI